MPLLCAEPPHLIGIPFHLIVVNIIVGVDAFAGIGVGIDEEQGGGQRTVGAAQLNQLVVPPRNLGLYIGIEQIGGGFEGKRLKRLV